MRLHSLGGIGVGLHRLPAIAVAVFCVQLLVGWTSGSLNASPPIVIVSQPVYTGWRVPSSSMEPTLHCAKPAPGCEARYADKPLVGPLSSPPKRGDILVFRNPPLARLRCGASGSFIKRLVGLPGEIVSERDGYLFINGKKLAEPYIKANRRDNEPPRTWARIRAAHYFVVGDNRAQSCDSRIWGTVPRRNIRGAVTKVYRQK